MQKLRDGIESMLREAVLEGSTVVPGWRAEIFAIVEEMIADEREACAKVCEDAWKDTLPGADIGAWNAAVNSCAFSIRERSNCNVTGAEPAGGASGGRSC